LFFNSDLPELFKRITDSKIIAGVKAQDDNILEWIYDNYYQTVKNHIIKNSGSPDDVPDIFQDTIIILYKQITADSLTLTSDLKAYFFGIARNLWNARLRQKSRMTGIEPRFDLADESDSEDNENLMFERIMSRAFYKLKPDCQTILTLHSEGFTYQEITEKMQLKNEVYARRKKYLCKEALLELVKADSEYQEYLRFLK
jgi:RNA polymerase sigma factor (sigma-70 family)